MAVNQDGVREISERVRQAGRRLMFSNPDGGSSMAQALRAIQAPVSRPRAVAPGREMSNVLVPSVTNRGAFDVATAQAVMAQRVHASVAEVADASIERPNPPVETAAINPDALEKATIVLPSITGSPQEREIYMTACYVHLACIDGTHIRKGTSTPAGRFSRTTFSCMSTILASMFSDSRAVGDELNAVHGYKIQGADACQVPASDFRKFGDCPRSIKELLAMLVVFCGNLPTREARQIAMLSTLVLELEQMIPMPCNESLDVDDRHYCFVGRIDIAAELKKARSEQAAASRGIPLIDLTEHAPRFLPPVLEEAEEAAEDAEADDDGDDTEEQGEDGLEALGVSGGENRRAQFPKVNPGAGQQFYDPNSEGDAVDRLYAEYMGEGEAIAQETLRDGVLNELHRLYLVMRVLMYVGADPQCMTMGMIKGIMLATETRMSSSEMACLASGVLITGLAKQPAGKEAKSQSVFCRYVAKRCSNAGEMMRSGSQPVGMPHALSVGYRSAVALTGTLQFGFGAQNRAFRFFQGLLGSGDSRLSAFAERTLELVKFSQRTQLREVLNVTIEKAPGVLELPQARAGLMALDRAFSTHCRHYSIQLFPMAGFLGLVGHRHTEAKALGALASGVMAWATPRDNRWSDFTQVDAIVDQAESLAITDFLVMTLGDGAVTARTVGRVIFRGDLNSGAQRAADEGPTIEEVDEDAPAEGDPSSLLA